MVDRNARRLRLLKTAMELEGIEKEAAGGAGTADGADTNADHNDRIIMMSPKAARRFRVRPLDEPPGA